MKRPLFWLLLTGTLLAFSLLLVEREPAPESPVSAPFTAAPRDSAAATPSPVAQEIPRRSETSARPTGTRPIGEGAELDSAQVAERAPPPPPTLNLVTTEGAPVPNCDVRVVFDSGTHVTLRSDAAGALRGLENLEAGAARLEHAPSPGDPHLLVRHALDPDRFNLPLEGPRQVRVLRPLRQVHVLVTDPSPVRAARVLLVEQSPDGELPSGGLWGATTDAQGRAWLGPTDTEPRGYLAWAEEGERVSALRSIDPADPPGPEAPLRLSLEVGAQVEVRVLDEHGEPVAATRIWHDWKALRQSYSRTLRRGLTDAGGRALFRGLPAGTHAFRVADLRNPHARIEAEVELILGAREQLDIRLPTPTTRMAAAGRVVDEEGNGLAEVFVGAFGADTSRYGRSDPDGRFEIWLPECAEVSVLVDEGLGEPVFAPSRVQVPFGTDDLLFRRVATPSPQRARLTVLDGSTGAALADAELWLFDPQGRLGEERLGRSAADGTLEAQWSSAHPSLSLGLWARGYADLTLELHLADAHAEGSPTRVALSPGGFRTWQVIDAFGEAPLTRVSVRAPGTGVELARTDSGGRFQLPAGSEPATLTLSLPDYVEARADTGVRSSWLEPRIVMWPDDWEERREAQRGEGR